MLGRVGGDFGRMGLVRPAGHLAGASLDLNFVASSGYPAAPSLLLTTTRASTAYADDVAGNWTAFSSNIPRITDKGLLVEEARTNSIRNNSMQGAVAGTPGTAPTNWFIGGAAGLTVQLVGTGTENGVDYIDYRFSGTTSGTFATVNFEAVGIVAASNGQTWAHSLFLKRTAGSVANISGLDNTLQTYTSGSVFLANYTSSVLASVNATLTRYSAASTIADATTAFTRSTLLLSYSNGVAIDITLRIGWPQLELGAFATSPIRTTSAAATRAADVIAGPALTVGSALTLFAEMTAGGSATTQAAAQVDEGAGANRVFLWRNNTTPSGNVREGGVDSASMSNGTLAAGISGKLAIAAASNDAAFCFNGGTVQTDATVTFPTSMNRLVLGQNGAGGVSLNGYLRRVAYFPTRLTNAQLQALTQ